MKLRAGDWVEVKSKEEILATLDKNGRLDEMPFMPQMFQYCGQKFKVYKRAHKTCDTVKTGKARSIADAVHLELRCDGEVYGGCQAACLLFWKTAWLKPVANVKSDAKKVSENKRCIDAQSTKNFLCMESEVLAGTQADDPQGPGGVRYICQATQLPYFSTALPWWDFRQYLEDWSSSNTTLVALVRGFLFAAYAGVIKSGIGLGTPLRWLYDQVQTLRGGVPFPDKTGTIPVGSVTPVATLGLQPGELVRVKDHQAILATLNIERRNRGMVFDAELVPFCNGIYRVRSMVKRYIDEKTGHLRSLSSPAVILDGVWCQARYSNCRMFCPRSIFSWWREIWLERVPEESAHVSRAYLKIEKR